MGFSPNEKKMLLVFDLDGTLIDSRRDIAECCNAALVDLGRAPLAEARIATYVGDGARKLLARALESDDASLLDRAMESFARHYLARPVRHTKWLPGAENCLHLRGEHLLAVATNKREDIAVAIVEALGAREAFACVVGGGGGPLKPDPAALARAVRESGFGGDARDVWMIGDGPQDVGAGKAFGATTVAVLGGFHSKEKLEALGPDHLIASLADLPPLLARAPLA